MKRQPSHPLLLPMTFVAAFVISAMAAAQNRLQNGSFEVSHYSLGQQKLAAPVLENYDLDYWCFDKNQVEVWSGYGGTNGNTMVHTVEAPIMQTFNLFGCTQAMSSPFTRMPNILLFDCIAQRNAGQPHFSTVPNAWITPGSQFAWWDFTAIGTASPLSGWHTLARIFHFTPSTDCQMFGFNDNFYSPTNGRVHFDNFYLFNCRDFDPLLPQSARGYTATNGTATDGHVASMFNLGDSRVVKLSSGTSKQCGIILAGYVGATVPATLSMTYDVARDPDCGPVYAYVSVYDFVNQRWRQLNPNYGMGPLGYAVGVTNTFRLNTVSTALANHTVPIVLPTGGPNNIVLWRIDFSPYKQPPYAPRPGTPPPAYPCIGVDIDRIRIF